MTPDTAATASSAASPSSTLSAPRTVVPQFFEGTEGRVYYRHWSTSSPRSGLVFLHSYGEHSGLYQHLAVALNRAGIDVWALDQLGHGLSDGRRGHLDQLDDFVAQGQRLTDLAGQRGLPLCLGGHGVGGVAATLSAIRYPQRYAGVVLSGTPLTPMPWLEETVALAWGATAALPMDGFDLASDPDYLARREDDPLMITDVDVVGVLARILPPAWSELDAHLPELTMPVLAIHGGDDAIAPAAGLLSATRALPNVRRQIYPDARHDVLNDTVHSSAAAAIANFITGIGASQSGEQPQPIAAA